MRLDRFRTEGTKDDKGINSGLSYSSVGVRTIFRKLRENYPQDSERLVPKSLIFNISNCYFYRYGLTEFVNSQDSHAGLAMVLFTYKR